jgi:hypothetical protein
MPAVHEEMAVGGELAGLRPREGESGPIDHVVQSLLQKPDHGLTSVGLPLLGDVNIAAELGLLDTVDPLCLLFLSEVSGELRGPPPVAAMLARRLRSAAQGTLICVATISF